MDLEGSILAENILKGSIFLDFDGGVHVVVRVDFSWNPNIVVVCWVGPEGAVLDATYNRESLISYARLFA